MPVVSSNWKAISIINNGPSNPLVGEISRDGVAYSHSVPRTLTDKLGEQKSLLDFNCAADGSDQTTNINNAMSACAALGITTLMIPESYTFSFNGPLVMQSNLTLYGQGAGSKLNWLGTATPGQGCIDVPAGVQNWALDNFSIECNVTTSATVTVQYSYAVDAPLTLNTTASQAISTGTVIWVHGGVNSSNGSITRLQINHPGGYSVLLDTSTGPLMTYTIDSNLITNARNTVWGVPGDYSYGGWTGGILGYIDGALHSGVAYTITDLTISNNKVYWCTGHGIWFHAANLNELAMNIQVVNNIGTDLGLDFIQMAGVNNGIVSGNKCSRVGYVTPADNTVGVPKWINNAVAGSVPGVAYDTAGLVLNCNYTNNTADAVNGIGISADGLAQSTISNNNLTSSWTSADPNAQASLCGPGVSLIVSSVTGFVGTTVTGVTSHAMGLVINVGSGTLYLISVTGVFLAGEIVSNGTVSTTITPGTLGVFSLGENWSQGIGTGNSNWNSTPGSAGGSYISTTTNNVAGFGGVCNWLLCRPFWCHSEEHNFPSEHSIWSIYCPWDHWVI